MKRSALLRALDVRPVSLPAPAGLPRPRGMVAPRVRHLPVQAALEWAFGAEKVRLDFGDVPEWHNGTDTVWRLMQRGLVGCEIDGGGRSPAHADAEVIASFVAALPAEHGGRGMAVRVAELARAGLVPDCLAGAQARCVPVAWHRANQGDPMARTEVVGEVETVHRGRRVRRPVLACPVTYAPSAQQIGAARRGWLDWWGALLHLGCALRASGRLESVVVTPDMPPMTPWRKGLDV